MNIDIERLEVIMLKNGLADTLCQSDWMCAIRECEIKTNDCNKCEYSNKEGKPAFLECSTCKDNPGLKSLFNKYQNELDNLFIGAPVMVVSLSNSDAKYEQFIYNGKLSFYAFPEHVRLPTVSELLDVGWVNKWFAPWLKMPEGLETIPFAVRLKTFEMFAFNVKEDVFDLSGCSLSDTLNWDQVEAVMILDEFKK